MWVQQEWQGGKLDTTRLDPETISEAMMYKSYLARQGKRIKGLENGIGISEADVSEEADI